jgi:hypothetical protein
LTFFTGLVGHDDIFATWKALVIKASAQRPQAAKGGSPVLQDGVIVTQFAQSAVGTTGCCQLIGGLDVQISSGWHFGIT